MTKLVYTHRHRIPYRLRAMLHHCVAHPLMGTVPCPTTRRLHDATDRLLED